MHFTENVLKLLQTLVQIFSFCIEFSADVSFALYEIVFNTRFGERELQSSGYEESQYRRPLEAELNEHRQSHASSGMPYRDTHELFVPDGSGKLI